MRAQFPIYIPSKGRYEARVTVKFLEKINQPYFIIVEASEYKQYSAVISKDKILVLDPEFQRNYLTYDDFGDTRILGGGPARNFAWEHSISNGHDWHWVMDDNIHKFCRYNNNEIIKVGDGTLFKVMEDFVLRYKNVAMAGPQYFHFLSAKHKWPPFVVNTRIYSCNLIRNSLPFRWEGRMNEDTHLSLEILKANWCTIQFNAFLQDKSVTQVTKGGNTEQYLADGTFFKSQWLVDRHPDVARLTMKYGRIHHHVDYSVFKKNKLIKIDGVKIKSGVDNYGMKITHDKQKVK